MTNSEFYINYGEYPFDDRFRDEEEEKRMEKLHDIAGKYPSELDLEDALPLFKAIKRYLISVGQFTYEELAIAWHSKLTDLWDCSNELEEIITEVA